MVSKVSIPPDRLPEVLEMYVRGHRLVEIAKAHGVTVKTLRETIAENKFPKREIVKSPRKRTTLSVLEVSAMLHEYENTDLSVEAILKTYNVPSSRLYAELQRSGRARRKRMPTALDTLSEADRAEIVHLYSEQRLDLETLASKFNLNYAQVYVVLRESRVGLRVARFSPVHQMQDLKADFRTLYLDEKMSVTEIMAKLKLTRHSFNVLLEEMGQKTRGKGGGGRSVASAVIDRMPEYLRRYEAGERMADLAKEADISLSAMKVRLKKQRHG